VDWRGGSVGSFCFLILRDPRAGVQGSLTLYIRTPNVNEGRIHNVATTLISPSLTLRVLTCWHGRFTFPSEIYMSKSGTGVFARGMGDALARNGITGSVSGEDLTAKEAKDAKPRDQTGGPPLDWFFLLIN